MGAKRSVEFEFAFHTFHACSPNMEHLLNRLEMLMNLNHRLLTCHATIFVRVEYERTGQGSDHRTLRNECVSENCVKVKWSKQNLDVISGGRHTWYDNTLLGIMPMMMIIMGLIMVVYMGRIQTNYVIIIWWHIALRVCFWYGSGEFVVPVEQYLYCMRSLCTSLWGKT